MAEVCEFERAPLSVDGTTSVTVTVQSLTLTVVVRVEREAAEGVRRALEFYERARRLLTLCLRCGEDSACAYGRAYA